MIVAIEKQTGQLHRKETFNTNIAYSTQPLNKTKGKKIKNNTKSRKYTFKITSFHPKENNKEGKVYNTSYTELLNLSK